MVGCVMGNDVGSYVGHQLIQNATQANTWYNVTVTWNTSLNTLIGYVNGVKTCDEQNVGWATTMPNVTVGGGFSTGRLWYGLVSVAAIYNKMLTYQEVQANFQALRGRYGV